MSTLAELDNFFRSELFPIIREECEIIKEEIPNKFERYTLYYRGNILRVEKNITFYTERQSDVTLTVSANLDTFSELGVLNIHEEAVFFENQLFISMHQLFLEVKENFKFKERKIRMTNMLNLLRNWTVRNK